MFVETHIRLKVSIIYSSKQPETNNLLGSWTPILILEGVLLGVSIVKGEYILLSAFRASLADRLVAEHGVDTALRLAGVYGDALISLFRFRVDMRIF